MDKPCVSNEIQCLEVMNIISRHQASDAITYITTFPTLSRSFLDPYTYNVWWAGDAIGLFSTHDLDLYLIYFMANNYRLRFVNF